ncbi:NACHT domain-containing protein [uncultured Ramlibacter sp.]|uniref:NACHT domain-containing protein n=1 Tax=uncultured Ramlibacter sp. TaxID=260755 RepID=UPI0026243A2B|nr:NACHT domain-containing protein [uncultured Ramlibacter sp.]
MVDKARAAKDGNEFHETWAARRSLELLMPRDELNAIAVEGFSVEDGRHVSNAATEIADLVLYYGIDSAFETAKRVEISQFKYSVVNANKPFVAADAKKILEKFVAADADYRRRFGDQQVENRLRFSIVTNRPIDADFALAVSKLASGKVSHERRVIDQAHQVFAACNRSPRDLESFLSRLEMRGASGSLTALKADVATRIVDWSASSDYVAQGRLGALKALVRTKAGTEGANRNVIRLEDVLSALHVADARDLLPTPASFVGIGPVVSRSLAQKKVLENLFKQRPVLLHAAGGVGKTVFMQALASNLATQGEVILFDCFGGGNYRSVEDSRHQPQKGLLHVVNALASKGLCDLIIPGPLSTPDLLATARRRFNQAVQTLRRQDSSAKLFLLIDAADNSAQQAQDVHEKAFPTLLMETFSQMGMPEGVEMVASCRTERVPMTKGSSSPIQVQLPSFEREETSAFLAPRVAELSQTEVDIAQVRSEGNPRVLAHLVQEWEGLVRKSPVAKSAPIHVEQLIEQRLVRALRYVADQGLEEEVRAFLCGLTVLPPPVPVAEYAPAIGLAPEAVESFAADLAPLLDRTSLGIVFRDEPTETFIREKYGTDAVLLQRLAERLEKAQGASIYAARALPRLLGMTEATELALKLAFSADMPATLTSDLGKRAIRTHRLTTALSMACRQERRPEAIRLLVELASVAANGDRLDALIASYPDMVAAVGDSEALRRLFEIRTDWSGARHSRLALVHLLMGNADEASLHAESSRQWVRWYLNQEKPDSKVTAPAPLEIATLCAQRASKGDYGKALASLRVWRPWFGFLVAKEFARIAISHLKLVPQAFLTEVLAAPPMGPALYAACIQCVPDALSSQRAALIAKLAHACKARPDARPSGGDERFPLEDALLLAAANAVSIGAHRHARQILTQVRIPRPSYHSFQQSWPAERVSRWLVFSVLESLTRKKLPTLTDIVPREIRECLPRTLLREYAKEEIAARIESQARRRSKKAATREKQIEMDSYSIVRILTDSVATLMPLCVRFANAVREGRIGNASGIIDALAEAATPHFSHSESTRGLVRATAREMTLIALQLEPSDYPVLADRFVSTVTEESVIASAAGLECLEVLCRFHRAADVGPNLLPWINRLIEREDDASHKGHLLARVSRILWPISAEDSEHYFRQSMRQLNALGSADYETVHDLLPLVKELKERKLQPSHFQRLANLCEMNFHGEPSKFPWVEFASAAVAAQGVQSLVQIGRWCSRDAASYDYTAPPLVVELVRKKQLNVELGMVLLKLDELSETHWFTCGYVAGVFSDANPRDAETTARELIGILEKDSPSSTSTYSLESILETLKPRLAPGSASLAYLAQRIAALKALPHPAATPRTIAMAEAETRMGRRRLVGSQTDRRVSRIAIGCSPINVAEVAAALKAVAEVEQGWSVTRQFLRQLALRVAFGDRNRFLEVLTLVDGLELDLRLEVLEETCQAWESTSPSIGSRRTLYFERLLIQNAGDLVAQKWRFRGSFERIARLGGMTCERAAMAVAGNLTLLPVAVNAGHWLKLATYLAQADDGQATHDALVRLLSGPALSMAASYGDGEHQEEHAPAIDECAVVAGLVWMRLGSGDAFERWRGAHAVRMLVERARFDVVDALVVLYRAGVGGACSARSVRFHIWDAKLWLLIGLSRAAKDVPDLVRRYSGLLMEEAFAPRTPHVLLAEFSVAALRCAPKKLAHELKLESLLRKHDPAGGPRTRYDRVSSDPYTPGGVPTPDHGFVLDYDFRKHEAPFLGRLFGLPAWEVAGMLEKQAAEMDPGCPGMYDGHARHSRGSRSGVEGRFRGYGGHLGWHGLFLLTSQLLKVRSVAKASDDAADPWLEFMQRYGLTRSDGYWLHDGTDSHPLAAHCLLRTNRDEGEELLSNPSTLMELAGIQGGRPLGAIVVGGSWESRDDVKIEVSSAFAFSDRAMSACRALSKRHAHDVWLPQDDGDEGSDFGRIGREATFEPWIEYPRTRVGWDEFDPLATPSANSRPIPGLDFRSAIEISASDCFGRSWRDKSGLEVMRAFAWGARRGYGDQETKVVANALLCETKTLLRHLADTNRSLVILVKIDRYRNEHSKSPIRYRSMGAIGVLLADGTMPLLVPAAVVKRRSDW